MTSPYLSAFLEAVDLAAALDGASGSRVWFNRVKDYVADYAENPRFAARYDGVAVQLASLARQQIAHLDPVNVLGRRCHVVSDSFLTKFREHIPHDRMVGLLMTIGEVCYRGRSVYDVTRERAAQVYVRGFQPAQTLDVHVWLTFEDMTIVDLTVMASLLRLGWLGMKEYERAPVIVGRAETLMDFQYIPYLVDNDFALRVDRF